MATALADLADVRAEREGLALCGALADPAAGEVEDLVRLGGHRQGEVHRRERVLGPRRGGLGGVRQDGALADQPGRRELDVEDEPERGGGVGGADGDALRGRRRRAGLARGDLDAFDPERRGEVGPGAVARDAGGAEPADRLLGQDGQRHRDVDRAAGDLRHARAAQGFELDTGDVTEVGAPVEHARQEVAGAVEHEAHAGRSQVQEVRC